MVMARRLAGARLVPRVQSNYSHKRGAGWTRALYRPETARNTLRSRPMQDDEWPSQEPAGCMATYYLRCMDGVSSS